MCVQVDMHCGVECGLKCYFVIQQKPLVTPRRVGGGGVKRLVLSVRPLRLYDSNIEI